MHKYENRKQKVAIVGARGYSGLELARLMLSHPGADLVGCFAGERAFSLTDFLPEPSAARVPVLPLNELDRLKADFIFLATPAEVSLELAPRAIATGATVIDLSGAFRLQAGSENERLANYERWYHAPHSQPKLLAEAHYGLSPFHRPRKASLVANPGCFATAALMGLVPLLRAGLLEPESIVIDAKSGTTGAGRKAAENLLFTEVDGDCLPYRVGKHQHLPEICQWAEALAGVPISPFFTTHLLPTRRGILAGIYANLRPGKTAADITAALTEAFAEYPLVRFSHVDQMPPWGLSLRKVTGTARTHLYYQVVEKKLYLFSLIDNLLKGAASQAVENFNQLAEFPVGLGLEDKEGTL